MLTYVLMAGVIALSLVAAGLAVLLRRARQAEAALRAGGRAQVGADDSYRSLMQHAPFQIIVKDAEGRYVRVNEAWENDYGISDDAARGKTTAEIFGDELGDYYAARDRAVLQGGEPMVAEEISPAPDGTEHSYITTRFPIRDETGKMLGLGFVATDITDRKLAERSLREVQERFHAVLDNTPFMIVLKDAEGRYTQVNRVWEKRYGLANKDVVGKTITEIGQSAGGRHVHKLFASEFAEIYSAKDRIVLESGKVLESEDNAPPENGVTRDFLTIRFPLRDGDGVVRGLGFVGTDITERKRAERALRDSEEQLRTITDNLPVLIVRWDREMRYRFANRTAEQWYGRAASEIIGRTIPEVFGDAAYESVRWAIDAGLSGKSIRFETTLDYPDGVTRDVEIAYVPERTGGGEVVGCFALVQDVSERKKLQADLFRKERLAAMGQLTATVAHELRNPLGAVSMSLGVIGKKVGETGLDLSRAIDRAARSMKRCETIITELLDFARARGLQPQPVELDSWLGSVLDEYDVPEGIDLVCDLRCADLTVNADADALRRAVINLMDNACDALIDGAANGSRKLTVSTARSADGAEIIITDNGPGIAADILPDIMEPLVSTKSFGTGLGLPTVKRIMEEHGGGIAIESRDSEGVRAILRLPAGP